MAVRSANATNITNMKTSHFKPEDARIEKYTLADALPAKLSELELRPRAMAQPSYSIRTLTIRDKEKVLQFLRRFFFRDEPMNLAVNLLETPESRCEELEDYATSTLDSQMSVAAVDEHGELVGVIINGLVCREDADYTDKSEECPNAKFRRILKVLGHLDREARIWEKVDCDKVMEIRIASTHTGWRGRGLMRALCEATERIAKQEGAAAIRMDTTSAFSAAVAERLEYRSVYSVQYSELSYAPQTKPPHLFARVYIKNLT